MPFLAATIPFALAADVAPWMPPAGTMVQLSARFEPALMLGIQLDAKDPFRFNFLIERGQRELTADARREEYRKLVKYFLTSLTTPNADMWVNLSPYEHERIIPDNFGLTEMGRDLLAQDYLLKQITSSLIHPDNGAAKGFWKKVYQKAYDKFGTTDIPLDTFNKVWIVPDTATIFHHYDTALIVENHLKVMMEQDYFALEKNSGRKKPEASQEHPGSETAQLAAEVVRQIVIPLLEKEVNEGEHFAPLRQVYSAMLMATWFKKTLKESLLGQVYADRSKVAGVELVDSQEKEQIYQKYLQAYKVGVFNFIKEDLDPLSQEMIPRKYFSGGTKAHDPKFVREVKTVKELTAAQRAFVARAEGNGIDMAGVVLDAAASTITPGVVRQGLVDVIDLFRMLPDEKDATAGHIQWIVDRLDAIDAWPPQDNYQFLTTLKAQVQSWQLWYNWNAGTQENKAIQHVFDKVCSDIDRVSAQYKSSNFDQNPFSSAGNVLRSFLEEDKTFKGLIRSAIQNWAGTDRIKKRKFLERARAALSPWERQGNSSAIMNVAIIGAGGGEIVREMKVWAKRKYGITLNVTAVNRDPVRLDAGSYMRGLKRERDDPDSPAPTRKEVEAFVKEFNATQVVFNVEGVALPFEDQRFDLVVVPSQVMPYILDKAKLLSEVKRVLKKGGSGFISDTGDVKSHPGEKDVPLFPAALRDDLSRSGQYAWPTEDTLVIRNSDPETPFPALTSSHIFPMYNVSLPLRFFSSGFEYSKQGDPSMQDENNVKTHGSSDQAVLKIKGGIDLDAGLLNMKIKRDGEGMPLPMPMQDPSFMNIEGLSPTILEISPVNAAPIFSALHEGAAVEP